MNREKIRKAIHEYRGMLLLVLLMTVFRSVVADWYDVPTGSMKPNILEGDRVFVNKHYYDVRLPLTRLSLKQLRDPSRGDIVVFYSPADGTRLIKRVIGVPGDVITLYDNHLYINGQPASYRPTTLKVDSGVWADDPPQRLLVQETIQGHRYPIAVRPKKDRLEVFGPVSVPTGHYFMMGDNRDNSGDSRYFGFVARDRIVGRASRVVLSLDADNHYLPRDHRYWSPLP